MITNYSLNTPKSDRDDAFYQDAFTSATNWGPNEFEKFLTELGFREDDPDDFFGQRAWRVWDAMTAEQRKDFVENFDDWLDG